jgi:hypothetical protein
VALSGDWRMSAIPSLSGDKQTCGERPKTDAIDPLRTPITQLVSAVEEVERRVDFLELALDFRALARTEIFLQPLQQSLLSRNEFWNDSQKGWLCSFIG